jgi:hypothetical protein
MRVSSSSAVTERILSRRDAWTLAGIVFLTVGVYLAASAVYYRNGFPLDDAWIHQTYARNLAEYGQWAFIPGKVSGGSTSPLWSVMLALGFLLRLGPYVWTYLLGAGMLWGIAVMGETAVRRMVPAYRPRFPWAGAILTLEWHLAWASVSGMETLLAALLSVAVLGVLLAEKKRYFGLGLLVGLSVWVRPDLVTLMGPILLVWLLTPQRWAQRGRSLVALGLGFFSLFAFYLLFNLIIAGSPWPNTFYAKQAEYAVYLQLPLMQRLGNELVQPLIGVGAFLLPGIVLRVIAAIRQRSWGVLGAVIWSIGFLGLYALRLPVTYQHGRYVIPAMPVLFIVGLAGLMGVSSAGAQRLRWVGVNFWRISTGLVLILFWGRGALAYARDVAVIESEMVATARWVAANVPPDALIGAHDIGALGYFGKHDLIDLAGLVSPDVIPFIRNEAELAAYLDRQKVSYLVIFPDWYAGLTAGLTQVYSTGAPYAPEFGETNMAVYRWPAP